MFIISISIIDCNRLNFRNLKGLIPYNWLLLQIQRHLLRSLGMNFDINTLLRILKINVGYRYFINSLHHVKIKILIFLILILFTQNLVEAELRIKKITLF